MTTKDSPVQALQVQANRIARMLKEAEKGNPIDPRFRAHLNAARERDVFVVGVVMDDKVLKIDLPWTVIREHSRDELAAWILAHMQERRDTLN